MYSARGRVVRSGIGVVGESGALIRALCGMAISLWVVGLRLMSIRRTVALVDSIWALVYRSSGSLVSHVPKRRIVGVFAAIFVFGFLIGIR